MRRLGLGKIPIKTLESTVLRMTGEKSDRVATPAKAGVDFAAVRLGDGFMLVSADPVTGVTDHIGTYALRVAANDIATSGNAPQFAESVILLPEGSSESELRRVALQIHKAAKTTGKTILGGHTEVTPGLGHPIVVATVFSYADKFVTAGDAIPGDTIMMTKSAGLEGTSELAREHDFPEGTIPAQTLRRARRLIGELDVTEEAVAAFRTGRVHAMHDCTEGGVLGAVFEMSLASGLGFVVDEGAVPVAPETREICDFLSIDPLRLIGSGSLLLAVTRGGEASVEDALRPVCEVTRIGKFVRNGRKIVLKDGSEREVKEAPQDELWRALGGAPRRRHRL